MDQVNIETAIKQRLAGILSFEQFTELAVVAGAEFMSHVHQANAYAFHSNEAYFSIELPQACTVAVSPALDIPVLKRAIKDIDDGKISPEQFYAQKALAGVSVTHLFFRKNRITYIGLNGEQYIEQW